MIGGAKNAALPLMAATLLTDQPLTLINMPELVDITTMSNLLRQHGARIDQSALAPGSNEAGPTGRSMTLTTDKVTSVTAPYDLVRRMRAGFFPFVEPGFEIDMECVICNGAGCKVCKQVGWIEVMPGGVPHPNVMRAGGINPDEWMGFYVNVGLDRLVMMRYGIDDVRLFHSADLRFLTQFR